MNENLKNIILVTSSAVPYFGGPISVLIDKYIPSSLEKRRNILLDKIDKDLIDIKEQIKPDRLESEEYITIFLKVFKNAISEHNQNKIELYRTILKNTAIIEEIDDYEIELFVRFVEILSLPHIFFLKTLKEEAIIYDNVHYFGLSIDHQLFCIHELINLGIIKEKSKIQNKTNFEFSDMGSRFYDFIFLCPNT